MSAPINPRGGYVVTTNHSTTTVTPVVTPLSRDRQINPLRANQASEVNRVAQTVIVQNPPSAMYVPMARLSPQPAVITLQAPPPAVIVSTTYSGVNPRDVSSYTVATRDGGQHTDINAGAAARRRF